MNLNTSESEQRIVATRSFDKATGGIVVANVFEPKEMNPHQWGCRFEISGLPIDVAESAYGVDSMQALMMALEGIRVRLENSNVTLTWLQGEPHVLGITRPIPFAYGLKVQQHLTKMVEDEVAEIISAKANGRT